ncbi:hypothetical protein KNP65_03740 [Latilactobacillus curvatus]|uniref:hypothetical protein n=1 Tax=Latilactobacillus curvatus TaxID=28038 RepID=UPI002410FB46|nr:hypothetical protein [Latilactobacillus curvatus]MDG2979050.1 hypothetical protein [Latilactobacillus curvatus]
MNNRLISTVLAGGLFVAIAFGVVQQGHADQATKVNVALQKQIKAEKAKNKNLDTLNDDLHQTVEKSERNKSKAAQSKVLNERALNSTPAIQKFFKTILTYDNDTYLSRFDAAASLAEKQPIQVFKGTGFDNKKPTQGVNSELTDVKFYFNQELSNKEIVSGLADVRSTNVIAGQTHKVEMLYQVTYNFLTNKITKLTPKIPISTEEQ